MIEREGGCALSEVAVALRRGRRGRRRRGRRLEGGPWRIGRSRRRRRAGQQPRRPSRRLDPGAQLIDNTLETKDILPRVGKELPPQSGEVARDRADWRPCLVPHRKVPRKERRVCAPKLLEPVAATRDKVVVPTAHEGPLLLRLADDLAVIVGRRLSLGFGRPCREGRRRRGISRGLEALHLFLGLSRRCRRRRRGRDKDARVDPAEGPPDPEEDGPVGRHDEGAEGAVGAQELARHGADDGRLFLD